MDMELLKSIIECCFCSGMFVFVLMSLHYQEKEFARKKRIAKARRAKARAIRRASHNHVSTYKFIYGKSYEDLTGGWTLEQIKEEVV